MSCKRYEYYIYTPLTKKRETPTCSFYEKSIIISCGIKFLYSVLVVVIVSNVDYSRSNDCENKLFFIEQVNEKLVPVSCSYE